MSKYDATLCNIIPIDLNFLLYVHNVYLNLNMESIRFPGRYHGDKSGFLTYDLFFEIAMRNWDQMLSAYNQNIHRDIETLQVNRYASWFTDDIHGKRVLLELWDSFNLWWWPDFGIQQFLSRMSDSHIPLIGDKLSRMAINTGFSISYNQLAVLMVFQKPPEHFKLQTRRVYVSSLAEMFQLDNTSIAHAMFDNLTNSL